MWKHRVHTIPYKLKSLSSWLMNLSQNTIHEGGTLISNTNFITDMLNINELDIESNSTISQSNDTVKIKVRLKSDPDIVCPLCKKPVIKNGFVSRTLTHSTLVNRKCIIV